MNERGDVVERLRAPVDAVPGRLWGHWLWVPAETLTEAADEIVRLRTELARRAS